MTANSMETGSRRDGPYYLYDLPLCREADVSWGSEGCNHFKPLVQGMVPSLFSRLDPSCVDPSRAARPSLPLAGDDTNTLPIVQGGQLRAEDFQDAVFRALQSYYPMTLAVRRYRRVYVLLLLWDCDDSSDDCRLQLGRLAKIFRENYGYLTTIAAIPGGQPGDAEDFFRSQQWLEQTVKNFINSSDKDDLLIIYYSGYGSATDNQRNMWLSKKRYLPDGSPVFSYLDFEPIKKLLCINRDVVYLLDTAYQVTGKLAKNQELIAASAFDRTEKSKSSEFTAAIADELEQADSKKRYMTVCTLFAKLVHRYWADKIEDCPIHHNVIPWRARSIMLLPFIRPLVVPRNIANPQPTLNPDPTPNLETAAKPEPAPSSEPRPKSVSILPRPDGVPLSALFHVTLFDAEPNMVRAFKRLLRDMIESIASQILIERLQPDGIIFEVELPVELAYCLWRHPKIEFRGYCHRGRGRPPSFRTYEMLCDTIIRLEEANLNRQRTS
ncbi:hypothetical protein AJ79_08108 [Helicocarpus griseus UAMH5409]|uniref:Uncharacterized protein n=1 Tax=Helicocarpus griseus UAMH5409 TaxID=1447875 RepID=A0A2B7WW07_9EURO|nr:hypothetical protein AJ79_08108 [Helicocarpus griseus UAMH5409]